MAATQPIEDFVQSEQCRCLLPRLYGDQFDSNMHMLRYRQLIKKHLDTFGSTDESAIGLFSTAGRTELAGNHTDHNRGKVIAASINLDTIAAARKTENMVAVLVSEGFPLVQVALTDVSPREEERGTTDALVRGIAAGFRQRGLIIGGFEANTTTRVLTGSGLSSSAAIEMLVATLFNNLYNEDFLSPLDLAIICQHAENVYFGKPSGLMDQIACGIGGIIGIDFADPKKPSLTPVSCNFHRLGYDLVVVNTQGSHADLTAEYAAIPEEMRAVASCFGKEVLREVPVSLFIESLAHVRKRLGNDRALLRAYHYFSENERVDRMLEALTTEDMPTYLALVNESGVSSFCYLQNLYSNRNIEEQGLSLALAMSRRFLGTEGACRVHGGGFAGTIQVYTPIDRTASYLRFMESVFGEQAATVLAIRDMPTCRIV